MKQREKETWKPFLQQQQQVMIKRGIFYPVKTIVAKDLDVGATWNGDITSTPAGLVPAGRFMNYIMTGAGSGVLTPWSGNFTNDALGYANLWGILAQDTDTTPDAGRNAVGMVYRRGTFLWQEVEEANRVGAAVGGIRNEPFIRFIRLMGINLEWSFEGYGLIETPPTPVPTIP